MATTRRHAVALVVVCIDAADAADRLGDAVGWRLSVTLLNGLLLPALVPLDPPRFAFLCGAHHYLALLLFAMFLLHLAAALFHALIRRDDVLPSMVPWRLHRRRPDSDSVPPAE